MKKRYVFLEMILCFLLSAIPAKADVIWEPMNSFYEKHASECTYVNRAYTADGPDGVVILYESPESDKVIATWENGKKVWISHTYEDERGVLWGISQEDEDGWMPMEYMKVVYDHISFEEEYGSDIESMSGELDGQYRESTIYFYRYPASEEYYAMDLQSFGADYMPGYERVYTDETGHQWGRIGYFYGNRDVWICLDAPTLERAELYPDGAPLIGEAAESVQATEQGSRGDGESGPVPEGEEAERIKPQTGNQMRVIVLVTVLVLSVMLVTAALLIILKKRGGGAERK